MTDRDLAIQWCFFTALAVLMFHITDPEVANVGDFTFAVVGVIHAGKSLVWGVEIIRRMAYRRSRFNPFK